MRTKNNSTVYDNLSISLKERIGFPAYYINLSIDQQAFADALLSLNEEILYENDQLKRKLSEIKDYIYEIDSLTEETYNFIEGQ